MPITVQRKKNDVGSKIIYNTEVLKSNLCDYNNGYILVRDNITVTEHQATQVALVARCKFCTISCIYHKNWWSNNRWPWRFTFSHDNIQFNRI